MSFRLLRVKRRADQDPATALYLPIEDDNKRIKTDTDFKEFRLFKIVDRGDKQPTKIVKPTERINSSELKVVLLSDSLSSSTVAEAILIDNETPLAKREISKLIKKNDISDCFDSFNINEESPIAGEFVYDVYRLDLGRFTAKDIEGRANCIQIVTYEQEFLNEESGSESEIFEDENDSNAEDYYANDYPDEESYISENDEVDFTDGELFDDEEGEFIFNESFEIEDVDSDAAETNDEFILDLDPDDYNCEYLDDSDTDKEDGPSRKYCYDDCDSEFDYEDDT